MPKINKIRLVHYSKWLQFDFNKKETQMAVHFLIRLSGERWCNCEQSSFIVKYSVSQQVLEQKFSKKIVKKIRQIEELRMKTNFEDFFFVSAILIHLAQNSCPKLVGTPATQC